MVFIEDAPNRGNGLARGKYLDGDFHDTAADEAVIPSEILIEAEAEETVLAFAHEPLGTNANLRFHAPPAQGADGITIPQHQHRRPLVLRSAAPGANNRAQGDSLTQFGSASELGQEIDHIKTSAR